MLRPRWRQKWTALRPMAMALLRSRRFSVAHPWFDRWALRQVPVIFMWPTWVPIIPSGKSQKAAARRWPCFPAHPLLVCQGWLMRTATFTSPTAARASSTNCPCRQWRRRLPPSPKIMRSLLMVMPLSPSHPAARPSRPSNGRFPPTVAALGAT